MEKIIPDLSNICFILMSDPKIENTFIIGGRKSLLSRIQISLTAKKIREIKPNIELKFYLKEAKADQDTTTPLWQIPEKDTGAFSSEFSTLLLEKKIDIVIHSYKDLAIDPHPKTEIIPILKRADQRDLLLLKKEILQNPPKTISIYTSSLRRMFLLSLFFKKGLPKKLQDQEIQFQSIRGNVPTRLQKLSETPIHGLVLSKAAIDRLLLPPSLLFLEDSFLEIREIDAVQKSIKKTLSICEFMVLPLSLCPNAAAQGSLAAEIRKEDTNAKKLISCLVDTNNTNTATKERKILSHFGGGCHQKIGIACLEKNYGSISYLHKAENNGKALQEKKMITKPIPQKTKVEWKPPKSISKVWPTLNHSNQELRIKRKTIQQSQNKNIRFFWVSRSEAWPKDWTYQNCLIWAAGVQTFFSLANQGVWVHGCADSLGENEDADIDLLMGEKVDFIKLTHQKKGTQSRWEGITTYQLEFPEKIPNLKNKTHFFWKSGSQFDWLTQAYPQILLAYHACAPGLTSKHVLENAKGPVKIFLDYKDWLSYIQEMVRK